MRRRAPEENPHKRSPDSAQPRSPPDHCRHPRQLPKGTAMSPIDSDQFTDMDGNAIEDSPRAAAVPILRQPRRTTGGRAMERGGGIRTLPTTSNASSAAPTALRRDAARGITGLERTTCVAASRARAEARQGAGTEPMGYGMPGMLDDQSDALRHDISSL